MSWQGLQSAHVACRCFSERFGLYIEFKWKYKGTSLVVVAAAFRSIKLLLDRIFLSAGKCYIFIMYKSLFSFFFFFFFFPFCANHSARWFPCVSGFRSFKRWLDASGEAVRQGARGVGGGVACCAVFCCLLPNVFCLAMREYVYVYIWVCVCVLLSPFVSFRSGQASRMKIWSSITSF